MFDLTAVVIFSLSCICQAGILEEMVEDTMEGLEDDDDEEEAQEEIDKVLFDLTAGKLLLLHITRFAELIDYIDVTCFLIY